MRLGLALLLLWTGCSQPAPVPRIVLKDFACRSGPFGARLPEKLSEVVALAPVVSRHETEAGERIEFEGLSVEVVRFREEPERYLLGSLTIRDRAWASLSPFRVGDDLAKVHALLGAGSNADPELRAEYGGEETDSVWFETRDGRLQAVVYGCYTG
jgi:hypothetical protein